MTLVDVDTGEVVAVTEHEVRQSIARAKGSLTAAAEEVVWQVEHRAWLVLGYADWNAMREAEYGEAAFMVPRQDRPQLVARMRRAGLTQADIAMTAGVAVSTVWSDLNFDSEDEPPSVTNSRGQKP